jgi:hypothetical protein
MLKLKLIAIVLGISLLMGNVLAEEPDWKAYNQVLKHLKPGVKNAVALMKVDYQAIKTEGSIDKAYQIISTYKVKKITNRNEKLSFYINAYNILALKSVVDHWPIKSIKDIGSWYRPIWNKPVGEVGGEAVSLGDIEHKILRLMGEPRIHFAIVCASVSCPNLRDEPYTADRLDHQLDQQVRQFLNNQGKGMRIEDKVIRVSKIFDWFQEDFDSIGGISKFIYHYKPEFIGLKVKANIPYDWSVNGDE